MKRLRSFLISLLITLLLLEGLSALLLRKGIIHQDLPTYSLNNARSKFWIEANPDFGVWHSPEASYHHLRTCFEENYQANSYGMRDPERSLQSDKPRVVVLGDSLIEGYGISDGNRITDILEKSRRVEYL